MHLTDYRNLHYIHLRIHSMLDIIDRIVVSHLPACHLPLGLMIFMYIEDPLLSRHAYSPRVDDWKILTRASRFIPPTRA